LITFEAGSPTEAERLVADDPFVEEDLLERRWVNPLHGPGPRPARARRHPVRHAARAAEPGRRVRVAGVRFNGDARAVGHILAQHATVALAKSREHANLWQAIDARKLIGQAQGMLMERFDLDADRAFAVLRRYSQDNNVKLHDVAQRFIDTRRLPEPPQEADLRTVRRTVRRTVLKPEPHGTSPRRIVLACTPLAGSDRDGEMCVGRSSSNTFRWWCRRPAAEVTSGCRAGGVI
jgi:ANTAR domain